jgi:hypothetical protein
VNDSTHRFVGTAQAGDQSRCRFHCARCDKRRRVE